MPVLGIPVRQIQLAKTVLPKRDTDVENTQKSTGTYFSENCFFFVFAFCITDMSESKFPI